MNSLTDDLEKDQRELLIVTGLSGSGKSVVIRALEDLGFYCVDNLPVPLIAHFLKFAFHAQNNLIKVALGVDARERKYFKELAGEVQKLKAIDKDDENSPNLKTIFLNAKEITLIRRFQETRRSHPLGSKKSISGAIKEEKNLLSPVMNFADVVLDTDNFNVHDLRHWVHHTFLKSQKRNMHVNLVSFGFKYGVPVESNLVYDLRFLPNPYFVPELKVFNGKSEEIQNYLFGHPVTVEYWAKLKDFLDYSIRKYYEEGRFFVNVAIGCTGGKHRSVAFVDKLSREKWEGVRFLVYHRDVGKE